MTENSTKETFKQDIGINHFGFYSLDGRLLEETLARGSPTFEQRITGNAHAAFDTICIYVLFPSPYSTLFRVSNMLYIRLPATILPLAASKQNLKLRDRAHGSVSSSAPILSRSMSMSASTQHSCNSNCNCLGRSHSTRLHSHAHSLYHAHSYSHTDTYSPESRIQPTRCQTNGPSASPPSPPSQGAEDPFPFDNPFIPSSIPYPRPHSHSLSQLSQNNRTQSRLLPSLSLKRRSKSATGVKSHITTPIASLTRRVSASLTHIFCGTVTEAYPTDLSQTKGDNESILNLPKSIRPDKSEIDFLRRTQWEAVLSLDRQAVGGEKRREVGMSTGERLKKFSPCGSCGKSKGVAK